jgi:phage baseplate assembly protein W
VAKTLTFKDLNITFKPHPITGDLIVSKDEAAIKQSIVNLLLTNRGERVFNANLGSSVSSLLFEPLDYGTAGMVSAEIQNTMNAYEPRIRVLAVNTIPDFDQNGFDVELIFEIIGREDIPLNVAFFLERTR